MSPLSVVIASYNAADTLGEQLDALLAQPWPAGGEIVVADNRSTDGTVDLLATYAHGPVPVRRVAVDDIAGAAHARNVAVAHVAHEHIAFCDADDIVGPAWVAAMTEALRQHAFVGGPLEYREVNEPWLASARGRLLAPDEPAMFENIFPIVSSCNMGVRRTLFQTAGGFDGAFERVEDAELSHRLWAQGVRAHHHPEALVHYRMRTTQRAIFQQSRSWGRQLPRLRSQVGVRPTDRPMDSAKRWAWLVVRLPRTIHRAGRAHWLHVAGTRLGALESRLRVSMP